MPRIGHPDLLDKYGAAELLGISVRTIESPAWRKKLPLIKLSDKIYRFRRSDIERFLTKKTVNRVEI
jgi:excisionase family DNA binding protein